MNTCRKRQWYIVTHLEIDLTLGQERKNMANSLNNDLCVSFKCLGWGRGCITSYFLEKVVVGVVGLKQVYNYYF